MSARRVLYHIARADFLERTRRHSFLIMLGLVLYLGYAVNAGQITLRLDRYRGVFNSAWVGSMMTLVVNFFLGWFGFYLVKNAISRDYETGVGQIMAATPLSRPMYMLGKWLSNFAVLSVMVFILMLAAVVMQILQREDPRLNVWALMAPFLFAALPFMALTAAFAVVFEAVGWLRGGFGNLVYFFFFVTVMAVLTTTEVPALDWVGYGLFSESMGEAARAVYPSYQHGVSLGIMPPVTIKTFTWPGVEWTIPVILTRLITLALAVGTALLGALCFDRFDPSRARPRAARKESAANTPEPGAVIEARPAPPASRLTPLTASRAHVRFGALLLAELRLALKGQRWWWYLVALGLIAAPVFSPVDIVRQGLLPAAWIWPILLWSSLGSREARHDTRQIVFSAPHPLGSQLPAIWLCGFLVAGLMAAGVTLNLLLAGDLPGVLSLLAGALFIPSLALASGVWTGSSKAFEIVYVLWWYVGPMNRSAAFDYTGASSSQVWPLYLALSLLLMVLAVVGREIQLRKD